MIVWSQTDKLSALSTLAIGPGAILPLFNNVWLHFVYNTVAYVLIMIAYFASVMNRQLASDLGQVRNQATSWG